MTLQYTTLHIYIYIYICYICPDFPGWFTQGHHRHLNEAWAPGSAAAGSLWRLPRTCSPKMRQKMWPEASGKTMENGGFPWDFMGFYGIYPLVMTYITMENDHRNSGFAH